MIKCKLCGTANFPNSSVCAKCGAELETSWYNTDTYSNNEIFSDTKAECMPRSTEQRDLFSSGEKYEKMKKGVVLKKIYKQEQALGEVTELEKPPEPTEVIPIVINRRTSSDIVGKNTGYNQKSGASVKRKIPQRKIDPVDPQLIGSKIQPQNKALTYDDDDEKVELTVSDSANNLQKKNKVSSTKKNNSNYTNDKSDGTKVYTQKKSASDKHKSNHSSDKATASPKTKKVSRSPKQSSPNQTVPNIQTFNSPQKAPLTKKASENRQNTVKNSSSENKTALSEKHSETGSSKKQSLKENNSLPKKNSSQVNYNNRKETHTEKHNVTAASSSMKKKSSTSKKSSFIGFTESDVDTNKYIAALSYLGILLIIPLLRAGTSNFCKAHSKQGAAVLLYSIIISLLTLMAVFGLRILFLAFFEFSCNIFYIIAAVIGILMLILLLIPVFSGTISAFSGEYRSVPFVGKFVNGNRNKKDK